MSKSTKRMGTILAFRSQEEEYIRVELISRMLPSSNADTIKKAIPWYERDGYVLEAKSPLIWEEERVGEGWLRMFELMLAVDDLTGEIPATNFMRDLMAQAYEAGRNSMKRAHKKKK